MTTTTKTRREVGVEDVVRRYYATVSDLRSTEDDRRRAGRSLLREQAFDGHEVVTSGHRAAVRATWRGVVGTDAGPFRADQELRAHVAALLTVRGGRVVEHETFECYEPFEQR